MGAQGQKSPAADKRTRKNILITGSSGMLGEAVRNVFCDWGLMLTDLYSFDVRNYDAVMSIIDKLPFTPDYIWHMAAETDLEICEMKPDHAYMTNTIGTINMVALANILKVPLIYMSTAGIFDGQKAMPYIEFDEPRPINNYGRSKYYGELAIKECKYGYYIFRMSWAMGGGPKIDKKFVNKVYQLIQRGHKRIYGITNLYGSPTYTYDVAKSIKEALINDMPKGMYHLAGIGKASRYDVAQAVIEILNAKVELIPVKDDFFQASFFSPRAVNETLESATGYTGYMRPWREALEEYLKAYYV